LVAAAAETNLFGTSNVRFETLTWSLKGEVIPWSVGGEI